MDGRHFVKIAGEELLPRIIRQFSEWADVSVATNDPNIAAQVKGTHIVKPAKVKGYYGVDLVRKGLELHTRERTIIVFGDVYFTEQAVARIKKGNNRSWAVYGRKTGNDYKRYGEYFAFELASRLLPRAREAVEKVRDKWVAKEWYRCTPWEWYYEMEGMSWRIKRYDHVPTGPHWVNIKDLTDDIDMAQDAWNLNHRLRA